MKYTIHILAALTLPLCAASLFAAPPSNDNFSSQAILLGSSETVESSNKDATKEPNEPNHAGNPPGHSVWWHWTAPTNGVVLASITNGFPGTVLAVYTGKKVEALAVVSSNTVTSGNSTHVRFAVLAGSTYALAVDGRSGRQGTFTLQLEFYLRDLPPEIIDEPDDLAECERQNAELKVAARSASRPLRYQWHFENTELPGQTNATLKLERVRMDQAGLYHVVVSNEGGSTNSRQAKLTVRARPPNDDFADRIGLNGSSVSVTGTNLCASAEAGEPKHGGGSGVYSVWWSWTAPTNGIVQIEVAGKIYQPRVGVYTGTSVNALSVVSSNLVGTTRLTNFLFAVQAGTAYHIAVDNSSNAESSLYQNSIELKLEFSTVPPPPEIIDEPDDVTECEGQDAQFKVGALSISPMRYQWYFNNVELANQTNATLKLERVRLDQVGLYQVVVSNEGGMTNSRPARLTVLARPPNDDFANRILLNGSSFSVSGTNLCATAEAGEPKHAGGSGVYSVWWSWTAPADGTVQIQVGGKIFQPRVGVCTGTSVNALSVVSSNLVGTTRLTNFLFSAQAGTAYHIAVDNSFSTEGSFYQNSIELKLESGEPPPQIIDEPDDVTECEGQNAEFKVVALSVSPMHYQWYFNNVELANQANATLKLERVRLDQAGLYHVVVSNDGGSTNSRSAKLVVVARPPNDDFADRIVLSGSSVSTTGTNLCASAEVGEPKHAGGNGFYSVWWSWTAPVDGSVQIEVGGKIYQPRVGVYTGASINALSVVSSNLVAGSRLSSFRFNVQANTAYHIAVDNSSSLEGPLYQNSIELKLEFSETVPPPEIIGPPSVVEGDPVRLEVTIGSAFQWRFNGKDIPGATNAVFELPKARPEDAGCYTVEVTDDDSATESECFILIVNPAPPPKITIQPNDLEECEGQNAEFKVAALSAGPLQYKWYFNNAELPSQTNATLKLERVRLDQAGLYHAAVSNEGGSTNSRQATLTVRARPPNDDFANRIVLSGSSVSETGTNLCASAEAGEPKHGGGSGVYSVWWSWTAPTNGSVQIQVGGKIYQPRVGVYTGASVNALSVVSSNLVGTTRLTNFLFRVQAGTAYHIAVDSGTSLEGPFFQNSIELKLEFSTVPPRPEIIDEPDDVTECEGQDAQFKVGALSISPMRYQWYFNNVELANQTNATLKLERVRLDQVGLYHVVVSNEGGMTNSRQARLTVLARPPNDDFANRILLNGSSFSVSGTNLCATAEAGEPKHAGGNGVYSVWWSWTAPTNGSVQIQVGGKIFQPRVGVYTGTSVNALSVVSSNLVGTTRLTNFLFGVQAGTAYHIAVDNSFNIEGSFYQNSIELKLDFSTIEPPPEIIDEPDDLAECERQNAEFKVVALSVSPMHYQWYFNNVELANQANATLKLERVRLDQAGLYHVVVSNEGGPTNSRQASLTVRARPPNDDFADRIGLNGSSVSVTGTNLCASAEAGEPKHGGGSGVYSVWWSWTAPAAGSVQIEVGGKIYQPRVGVYTGSSVNALSVVSSNLVAGSRLSSFRFNVQANTAYHIAVDNSSSIEGSFYQNSIDLKLNALAPPKITRQPSDQEVARGENAVFNVRAESFTPLRYQWFFDGVPIAEATNAELTVTNVNPVNEGEYTVEVSNDLGFVISQPPARLRITAVITGMVTDAITRRPLPNVEVSVSGKTDFTDRSGNYRITGVSGSGSLRADFAAQPLEGIAPLTVQFENLTSVAGLVLQGHTNTYEPYVTTDVRVSADQVVTNSFSMTPLIPDKTMRLVLNWKEEPRDLDAHLLTPAIDGRIYHIYFPQEFRGSSMSVPYATLDFDYTNGVGPETITISRFFPGRYSYYVQKYAGLGEIAGSGASVRVYQAGKVPQNITAPEAGNGPFWHVCDVDGSTLQLTVVNQIQTNAVGQFGLHIVRHGGKQSAGSLNQTTERTYFWDFGDGKTSKAEHPVNNYTQPGTYTVSLRATAGDGSTSTETKTNYIRVLVPMDTNSRPVISAITDLTILEDSIHQIAFSVSDAETRSEKLLISASSWNTSLIPSAALSIQGAGANRALSLAPLPNQFGEAYVMVTADDGQHTSGELFKVTVIPVNDPPTLDPIVEVTIDEDVPEQTIPLTGITSGAANELQTLMVTAGSDNPTLIPNQAVSYTSPSATGFLSFTPIPNANGLATITVNVNDGGAENATITRTFKITVRPVNDAPSFTKGPDITVRNTAGPQTITAWATDLKAGPPDEAQQTLTFHLSNVRQDLFAVQPAIDSNGTLTFTPTLAANGTNSITATLQDGGGTAYGGIDKSLQMFKIIVGDDPPTCPSTVIISTPQNRTCFQPGFPIQIAATVSDGENDIERVEFYAGTVLLGVDTASPYEFTWEDVSVGDYCITAVAVCRQGTATKAAPVCITVSELAGDVAIIQNRANDPEVTILVDYLYEMGLCAQVFEPAQVTFEILNPFKLVIWHDLGNPLLPEGLVSIFEELRMSPTAPHPVDSPEPHPFGMPLYFIGEHLASATLSDSVHDSWMNLVHLVPTSKKTRADGVEVLQNDRHTQIIHDRFGWVRDFAYSTPVDDTVATVMDTETGTHVLGRVAASEVLVAVPALDQDETDEPRTFTQNVRVLSEDDAASIVDRKALFQNAVCWLIRCPKCSAVDLAFEDWDRQRHIEAEVGEPVVLSVLLQHGGECEGINVVARSVWPLAFDIDSAESRQGTIDISGNIVTFHLGHVANASLTELKVTCIPHNSGTFTNVTTVEMNGPEASLDNNVLSTVYSVSGASSPPSLGINRDGQILTLTGGESGRSYRIQASSDLINWYNVSVAIGRTWSKPLEELESGFSTALFYRAVSP